MNVCGLENSWLEWNFCYFVCEKRRMHYCVAWEKDRGMERSIEQDNEESIMGFGRGEFLEQKN